MPETFFHCAPILLGEGSIIRRGNWGRIIRLYQNQWGSYPVAFRERVLEDIRSQEFPSKPSRLNSLFLLPDLHGAETYQNHPERRSLIIYEVELVNPNCARHVGDWTFCFVDENSFYFDEMLEHAREYWRGEGAGNFEYVVESDARVLRKVDGPPPRMQRPDRLPKARAN